MTQQRNQNKFKLSERYPSPLVNSSSKSRSVNLKGLLEDIKYLQTCMTSIEPKLANIKSLSVDKKRSLYTPKKSQPLSNPKSNRININNPKKCKRQHSLTGIKRKATIQDSNIQENKSQTLKLKTFQQNQIHDGKTGNSSQSYLILQMQNLRLQKQSLSLENKLLQQQLFVERKQKHILKSRLKKMKIHLLENKFIDLPKMPNHTSKTSNINEISFNQQKCKPSPIRIDIPEFKVQMQANKYKQKNDKSQSNYSVSTYNEKSPFKDLYISSEGPESILLSNYESVHKKSSNEHQGSLQNQFWRLMNQCEKEESNKKWEIREALGDIANKLKVMRKH